MPEPLNYEGPTADAVVTKVKAFLENPILEQDASWPPVTDDDLRELSEVFADILEAKYQRDCDGDMVIDFALNRRNWGRMYTLREPHTHREELDIEDAMRSMSYAAAVAGDIIKRQADLIGMQERGKRKTAEWRDKCGDILVFCAMMRGHVRAEGKANTPKARLAFKLEEWTRKSALYGTPNLTVGHNDEVWAPLGLTCEEINVVQGDSRQRPNDLFDLINTATTKWMEENKAS